MQDDESRPWISWACASPGLRTGGDAHVGIVVSVDADAIWAGRRDGPPPEPGTPAVNGLQAISLRFIVPAYAKVIPLCMLEGSRDRWQLPDIAWADQVLAAFRIEIDVDEFNRHELPAEDAVVQLARLRFHADATSEDGADSSSVAASLVIALPLLDEQEWREAYDDPEVAALVEQVRGGPPLVVRALEPACAATLPAHLLPAPLHAGGLVQ